MAVYEIPLAANNQRFNISLGGVTYIMTVTWCPPAMCWTLDIADESGVPIITGIPMITGTDLLEQYEYLGITGSLVVQTDFEPNKVPDFTSLGTTGHLYFLAPDPETVLS